MPEEQLSVSATEWLAAGKAAFVKATSLVEELRRTNARLTEELMACEKQRRNSMESWEECIQKGDSQIDSLRDENAKLRRRRAFTQELLDTTVMSLRSLLGYCDCYPDKRESMKTGIVGILDVIVKGKPQGKGGG